MRRFLPILALCAVVLLSCEKAGEKAAEPSVFKVSPKSAASENGFAHSLSVKVTCDIPFEYSLGDGSWIDISASERDSKNVTTLTLSLSANEGDAERSDELSLRAGSKSLTFSIKQKTVSGNLPASELRLSYIFPSSLTFQFPVKWSLSTAAEWLEFSPQGNSADILTPVEFKAGSFNLTSSPRTAELVISFEGAASPLRVQVVQESSLPSGDFGEGGYGLYNYDAAGASVVWEPLSHQTNLVKRSSGSLFRLVDPSAGKMYEIGGLPLDYTPGDALHLVVYQNWLPALPFRSEHDAWVLKADGTRAWLIDSDSCGYVVKK